MAPKSKMSTKNEKGSVLVELTLALAILLTFEAGLLAIHRAWNRRYHAIVRDRNHAIETLRGSSPASQLLPGISLPRDGRFGLPASGGEAGDELSP